MASAMLQDMPPIADTPQDSVWGFVGEYEYGQLITPIVTGGLFAVDEKVVGEPKRNIKPLVSLARKLLASGDAFVKSGGNKSRHYVFAKRCFDLLGAMVLLLLFSPIILVTFFALLITTRGRPIFRQVRLGHRGLPFTMYKFRTMGLDALKRQNAIENEKDGPIFKNRNDPRITRLGRILRKTSVDELPQLLNVLAGQMSLVGPRPPIGNEVARYVAWQRRRLSVKPGLTCLWQISGRSEVSFDNWVRMDLWYVRNQSFATDLALLLKTPWSVLCQRGAC